MIRLVLVPGMAILLLASCGQALAQPGPGGEDLVDVVVAARDIAAGEWVKPEDLAKREVRSSLVTSSVVTPDQAIHVVDRRIALPMLRGDLVNWSFFETLSDHETYEACHKVTATPGGAREQVARARQGILAK
jgi:Flp pilus assembly protein CpaB